MKNKFFVIVIVLCMCVLIVIIADNQQSKENANEVALDTYVFPITHDSPEWQNYVTIDEKIKATLIPYDVLSTISTDGLIQTILNHPLLPNVYAYSSDDDAFLQMYKQLDVFEEVCSRDDAGTLLLSYFSKDNDKIQLKALDLILSSTYIQEKLTNEEKKVYKQLNEKFKFDEGGLIK